MKKLLRNIPNKLLLFFAVTAIVGLALGLSDMVFSNYFKDAYNVSAVQRGLIEFPRELPGLLCIILISILSFLGDIRIAIITQALSFIGVLALGLLTPTFAVMLIFLFINSLGMHLYMPVVDSIGMNLVEDKRKLGKRMGQYKSVNTAFQMIAGLFVFIGFRYDIFRFDTQIKWIFILSAALFLVALLLYIQMSRKTESKPIEKKSFKITIKKEYTLYYILATMHGAQKQIMIVFGPWVLIEILGRGAETMGLLAIIGSFLSIFFLRWVGKWIDHYGVKKLLVADALSFIGVYILYGILSAGFHSGSLAITGLPFILACALLILDRMSMQMSMIRVVYLKKIAKTSSDIMPTLSAGISMDHIVSMVFAYLGGLMWMTWGPQYVFFIAAALSLVNLVVARLIKVPSENANSERIMN